MGKIAQKVNNSGLIGQRLYHFAKLLYQKALYYSMSDEKAIKKRFKQVFGRDLNLTNPQTLNEKLQWLKLNKREDFYTLCADKYSVRKYLAENFGEELLIPLLYVTDNYKDIVKGNIPDEKCIVKSTHDQGHYLIIRDKNSVDYKRLQESCRYWLKGNLYYMTREWQYKNIKPRIVIEKLLETKDGRIPNDYKLHFINGEFQFIYVSYDREGVNDRCIFDRDWNRMPFMWIEAEKYQAKGDVLNTSDVEKPATFEKMLEIGTKIAQSFNYVRVDFYDVDGKLYFGEITLYHGSGFDRFFPDKFDLEYGRKLNLQR